MNAHTERITSQFPANLAGALSLSNDRLFAVAVLFSIAPLWMGQHLPMVDISQHAAQITAMHEMWAGNATFTDPYQINWFTPYLLGYMLLYVVSLVVPVAVATQIVISLAVMAVPWLTGKLLKAVGADERWKWLAIPSSFGFAFYWGFLSYMVATPVALLFLIKAIRFARDPTLRNALLVGVFSIFLFFCHVIVLCYVSLAALAFVFGVHRHNFKQLVLRMLPFTAPLPLIAIWLVITYTTESAAKVPSYFGDGLIDRLYQLLLQPSGLDVFSPFFTVPALAALLMLPALSGSTFSRRCERWLPFVTAFVVFMVLPGFMLNTGYINQRLGIFLTPLWLLAWDAPRQQVRLEQGQIMQMLALPLVFIFIGINLGRYAAFARETRSFDDIMASAEPNRRVASLIQQNLSPLFSAPVYMHYTAWYTSTHRGIVDYNFADFYSQTVRYKPDAGPRLLEGVGWTPTLFSWEKMGGEKYDYFVLKASFDMSKDIFKDKRDSVELVARSGPWWLYRNLERSGGKPLAKSAG